MEQNQIDFRAIVDSLPTIVWLHDEQGNQVYVNQTFCDYFGMTLEELQANGWHGLVHPEDAIDYARQFDECVAQRLPFHARVRVRRADGACRWMESWGRPRFDDTGAYIGHAGTSADVTEQKLAEDALAANEALLRSVSDAVDVAVYAKDREGRLLLANRTTRAMLGRNCSELVGLTDADLFSPESAAVIRENDLAVMRSGETLVREEPGSSADGTRGVYLSVKSPLMDKQGATIGVVGVTTDITERKRAEQATAENEQRLRRVLDQLFAFVGVLSPEGIVEYANEAPLKVAGISLEDVAGKPFDEAYWWSYDETVQQQLRAAMERALKGETVRYDVVIRVAEGQRMTIDFQIARMLDDAGNLIGLIPSAIDVTARAVAERQRELLVAELNHRVKNTLAIVQNLAWQSFRDLPEVREQFGRFERRLGALAGAHNLLTRDAWEATLLGELISQIVWAACGESARLSLDGPKVRIDPKTAVTMALAMHELSTNAVKHGAFSNADGHVSVNWRLDEEDASRLILVWRERGGPPVQAPRQKGFGSRMIERALAMEMQGRVEMDYQPEGLVCTVEGTLRIPGSEAG